LIQNKVDGVHRPGQTYSESVVEVPVKDEESSPLDLITTLPQTLGTLAVAAIKFVTPKQPQVDRVSVPSSPGRPGPVSSSEVRPLIDLEDPNTLTFGMLGVAGITGIMYAITSTFDPEESSDSEDEAESKEATTSFERFAADHFLTNFESKRSFDNIKNAKVSRDKTNSRRRRKRRNTQNSVNSSKFYQPVQSSFLYWKSRTS